MVHCKILVCKRYMYYTAANAASMSFTLAIRPNHCMFFKLIRCSSSLVVAVASSTTTTSQPFVKASLMVDSTHTFVPTPVTINWSILNSVSFSWRVVFQNPVVLFLSMTISPSVESGNSSSYNLCIPCPADETLHFFQHGYGLEYQAGIGVVRPECPPEEDYGHVVTMAEGSKGVYRRYNVCVVGGGKT